MVDRLPEWQDWSSGLIQHRPLLSRVQFSRKTMNFQHSGCSEECHIVHLNVISLVFASTSMSCKSVTSPKRQWQPRSWRKNKFPTLSPLSICHNLQFVICHNLPGCHRRVQTTRVGKKSPKTLILAGPPEKIEMCPPFHQYFTLSPIFPRNCYTSKQGRRDVEALWHMKIHESIISLGKCPPPPPKKKGNTC